MLTMSKRSRMAEPIADTSKVFDARVKRVTKQRTDTLEGTDVGVGLDSSADGSEKSRSCDGGEEPVRTAKRQRFRAEA